MASFRNPPRLSSNLAIGTVAALARRTGRAHWFMNTVFARALSEKKRHGVFAGYEPTGHDVFVVTFPKSGTNWAMQIAQQTAWRGAADFDHIYDLATWPEAPFAGIVSLRDDGPRRRSPTDLRVIRSAMPATYIPYSKDATYITVVRDPKEVVVSSYLFLLGVFDLLDQISFDEWVEMFVGGRFPAGSWAAHVESFWSIRERPNVRVLMFSEMKKDLETAVRTVAEAMDVSLSDQQFAAVVERSSFGYMKKHDASFGPPRMPFTRERTALVRSGKSGASGEMLSRDQQAAIDRYCRDELARIGSTFPYEDMFEIVE